MAVTVDGMAIVVMAVDARAASPMAVSDVGSLTVASFDMPISALWGRLLASEVDTEVSTVDPA